MVGNTFVIRQQIIENKALIERADALLDASDMVLVLILCGVLAYRLAQQITRPINAIDLDNPVADKNYTELSPFLNRIQEQNRTIRKQMSELSLRQREFTAITENMDLHEYLDGIKSGKPEFTAQYEAFSRKYALVSEA